MKIERELKKHPKVKNLRQFLADFFKLHTAEIIILFGSAAKKTYNHRSDLDLLIISDSLDKNFFTRLLQMQEITPGGIDFFVYNLKEFEQMASDLHLIALEALSEGMVIHDEGRGEKLIKYVKDLIKNGTIQKLAHGWKINQIS